MQPAGRHSYSRHTDLFVQSYFDDVNLLLDRLHSSQPAYRFIYSPLMPPSVIPRIKYLCTNRKARAIGPVARTAIAIRTDSIGTGIPVVCGLDARKSIFADIL